MRVAIAQVNPTVGDLSGNRGLVERAADDAAAAGADLLVLPEPIGFLMGGCILRLKNLTLHPKVHPFTPKFVPKLEPKSVGSQQIIH